MNRIVDTERDPDRDPDRDPRLHAALRHAPDADLRAPELLSARILASARRAAAPQQADRAGSRRWLAWSGLGTATAAVLASAVLWVGREELPKAPEERLATAPAPQSAAPSAPAAAVAMAPAPAAPAPSPAPAVTPAPQREARTRPRAAAAADAVAPVAAPPAPPEAAAAPTPSAPAAPPAPAATPTPPRTPTIDVGRTASAEKAQAADAAPPPAPPPAPMTTALPALMGASPSTAAVSGPRAERAEAAPARAAAAPMRPAPVVPASAPPLARLLADAGSVWRLAGRGPDRVDPTADARPWLARLQDATAGRWQRPDADAVAAGAGGLPLTLRRDDAPLAVLRLGADWVLWCEADGSDCRAARAGWAAVEALRAELPRGPR